MCITLMSFTEDMGNLAVAVACMHPTCETELMGMAIAFSFKIPNMFKGRQGTFFEDRMRPEGLGRNLTSCFPIAPACCSSPGHCLGHLGPAATSCPHTEGTGATRQHWPGPFCTLVKSAMLEKSPAGDCHIFSAHAVHDVVLA